jgi:hypothetical protein
MKRIRFKALTVGGLLAVSAVVLALSPPRLGTERYQLEKTDIQKDLAGIEESRAEIDALKDQKKADKKADNDAAVIVDRKLIKKAKADLKHDKAYLRADKTDMKQDYRLAIREQKDDVKESGKELSKAKKELRKEIRQDDSAGIESAAGRVAALVSQHEVEEAELADLKDDRRTDLVAVNDAISETNGEYAGFFAMR